MDQDRKDAPTSGDVIKNVFHPDEVLRTGKNASSFNIMNGLAGHKIFVHCGGNIKSSNLIHMYQVLMNGKEEKDSFGILTKIQSPESKWFDYFRSFGMKGDVR